MSWGWDRRIARATELQSRFPEASGLLSFYSHIAQFQKSIAERLSVQPETDPLALAVYYPDFFSMVEQYGPPELSSYSSSVHAGVLTDMWTGTAPENEPAKFFARVLLQPFAEALASRGNVDKQGASAVCPFCNARAVAGILRGEGEGAKRSLLCSLCATEWQYRRIVCPNCGEEDKERLPIYLAGEINSVRIDACDTCRTYIKSVDLTKDGHAVPIVDELATLALTVWADENGYAKAETNLLGM